MERLSTHKASQTTGVILALNYLFSVSLQGCLLIAYGLLSKTKRVFRGFLMIRILVLQGLQSEHSFTRAPKKHISKHKHRDIPYKPPYNAAQ